MHMCAFSPWCISILTDVSSGLQIKWHPFFLNPSAPKEGVNKKEYYLKKFGSRSESMEACIREVFPFSF